MSGEDQSGSTAGPDAYAAALDRLLDGLEPEADGPEAAAAGAQASADIDSITRALGLIGDALAGDGASAGGTGAAAGAALPGAALPGAALPGAELSAAELSAAEGGATVIELSAWRRALNPRVLAAAAVGLLVIGLGVPIAMSTGGGDSNDVGALDAPGAQSLSAPAAPESATAADTAAGLSATYADPAAADPTAAAPGAAAGGSAANAAQADTTGTKASEALTQPGSAPAPLADNKAAPAAGTASGKSAAKRDAADTAFSDAVACARAILVGQITAVQPGSTAGRVKVTLLVTSWIAPTSGPALITYEVGNAKAFTPDGEEKLTAGQRRLFVFPAKPSAQAYAYPDSAESRDKIAAVRAERSGEACQ